MVTRLRFYRLMSRLFPNSLSAKVAFLVFCGMHFPAVIAVFYLEAALGDTWEVVRVVEVLVAVELVATVATVLAIVAVLAPVFRVSETVNVYATNRSVRLLPEGYHDEVGRLMSTVNALMLDVDAELDAATRKAETDPLTGLLNRRGFLRLVPPEVVGTILFIDIDHFKRVNDDWGHAAGDNALVAAAEVISGALRSRDVLARMGGEEFAVFLDEPVVSRARDVAERVRKRVAGNVIVHGRPLSVSIGMAIADSPRPLADLLTEADQATYGAKKAGRNRVNVFRPEHSQQFEPPPELGSELGTA